MMEVNNSMIKEDYRKHSRTTAISALKELKIHIADKEKILKLYTEESTEVSPLPLTPTDPVIIAELSQVIENIKNQHKLQMISKGKNSQNFRQLILSSFFKLNPEGTEVKNKVNAKKWLKKAQKSLQYSHSKKIKPKVPEKRLKKIRIDAFKIQKNVWHCTSLPLVQTASEPNHSNFSTQKSRHII